MKERLLTSDDVLRSYDVVSSLYPYVPSLSHWRAWEHAAYRDVPMTGRCLDLGCGDGRYFRLLWPHAKDVVGVEIDPAVAELGRASGVYTRVHTAPAHAVPEDDAFFDHVFANCSLEHMDQLDDVLAEIHRCLRPGGTLVCSVVTDRFVDWALLPNLAGLAGHAALAREWRDELIDYHHLANPLTVEGWRARFAAAGLVTEEHVPLLPEFNSGIFLLMESVWHFRKTTGGELGDVIHPYLAKNANFPAGFRSVVEGLLAMETDWRDCSGAMFVARKGLA